MKIYMEVMTMTAYKKGWLRASIAGGITSLLTLFLYLSGQPYQVNKSTFLTGLIVAIILATAPIYDDNRLSLKQQSLLHFSIMCVTILPILCLSGWYPLHNVVDFLKILASFLDLRTGPMVASLPCLWKTSPQMISKPDKKDFN